MNTILNKPRHLQPENFEELLSWSKRWRVSIDEVNRAIIETGSTNTRNLKAHIKKSKVSDSWKQLLMTIQTLRKTIK